ncbi:spore germination protein, partial [Burkholderia multivorans]
KLSDLKETLKEVIGLGVSFDVIFREMNFAGRNAGLLFLNGFTNDMVVMEILTRLTYLKPEDVNNQALNEMMNRYIPHVQVERDTRLSKVIDEVLSGLCALFIEDAHSAIILDTR